MLQPRLILSGATMAAVALLLGWLLLAQLGVFREQRSWVLSTGFKGGLYHGLGQRLAEEGSEAAEYDTFRAVASLGSAQNMERLAAGEAQLGLVQSDVRMAPGMTLVANLYEELVHVLVRRDLEGVEGLEDFGRLEAVNLGPEGSGTRNVAEMLLAHFEVELANSVRSLEPGELDQAFASGKLDAAFLLAGAGSEAIDDLLDGGHVRLLSMGRREGGVADAVALLHPEFQATILPVRLYGDEPTEPLSTVAVTAMLVAQEKVADEAVRMLARTLDRKRTELSRELGVPLRATGYDPSGSLAYHPGAESHYLRERPSFLVEYAEVISLGLTLLVGVWSLAGLFMRWRADLKKERIDLYYRDISSSTELQAEERLEHLNDIHKRAFEELMAERLAANESFVIFHDYLLSEIARAERQVAEA